MNNPSASQLIIVRVVDRKVVFESAFASEVAARMWGQDCRAYQVYALLEPLSQEVTEFEKQINQRLKGIEDAKSQPLG